MSDTILCHDKEDAKNVIDALGGENIKDWEFLPDGKIKFILVGKLVEENDSIRIDSKLSQYDADVEVQFWVTGNLDIDTIAEFDRDSEDDEQKVTVNVDIDDRFEFSQIKDWTRGEPRYIEIQLEY